MIRMPAPDSIKSSVMLAGLIVAGFIAWKAYKNAQAVAETAVKVVTEKLNPASDKNVAYAGANSILQTLTGDPGATLGGKIYDWTH